MLDQGAVQTSRTRSVKMLNAPGLNITESEGYLIGGNTSIFDIKKADGSRFLSQKELERNLVLDSESKRTESALRTAVAGALRKQGYETGPRTRSSPVADYSANINFREDLMLDIKKDVK